MTTIKGYLIECQGRELFLRENVEWALEDSNYKVTPLVAQQTVLDTEILGETQPSFEDYRELTGQLYDVQKEHILSLENKLEEAVELVESIHEFCSKKTDNVLEMRGIMLLVSESCARWLKAQED